MMFVKYMVGFIYDKLIREEEIIIKRKWKLLFWIKKQYLSLYCNFVVIKFVLEIRFIYLDQQISKEKIFIICGRFNILLWCYLGKVIMELKLVVLYLYIINL